MSVLLAVFLLTPVFQAGTWSIEPLSRCWSYSDPILRTGGIVVDESAVYLVDTDNKVKALSRSDGDVIWNAELGGRVESPLVGAASSILVLTRTVSKDAGAATYYIRAVSKTTGITKWVAPLSGSGRYSMRPATASRVMLEDGTAITAVDVEKGQTLWSRPGTMVGDPAKFENGSTAIISPSGKIEVLSLTDGQPVHGFQLSAGPTAIAWRLDDSVVFGDARGNIEARGPGDTRGWTYKTGGAVSRLVISGDNVIAASNDNFLYSISLRSGDVAWRRRLPGRVSSVDMLGSGRAGVTVVGEKTAFVVDVADGRFLEQLVLGAEDEFIGYPLMGDDSFLAALTMQGLTAFSTNCRNERAALNGAAR